MGRINEALVLEIIRVNGPLSRADIARETGLSKPSTSRVVNQLLDENLILAADPLDHQNIGRKPELLQINADARFFACIDIGGAKITFTLGSWGGELTTAITSPNPKSWKGIVSLICNQTDQLLVDAGIPREKLGGVGIAVQGVVNTCKGTVSSAPSISGGDEYPLKGKLETALSSPIVLENDVNAAAIGEIWKGNCPYSNMVYISLGSAIGGGLILNNRLFRGTHHYAGEVGWLITGKEQFRTTTERYGPLELVASGPALKQKAEKLVQQPLYMRDCLAAESDLGPECLFKAYLSGNSELAREIVAEWIEDLAIAICNIASLLNVEAIILGGGLTYSGGFFLADLRNLVNEKTQFPPTIELSRLRESASLYGMLKLCLDRRRQERLAVVKAAATK